MEGPWIGRCTGGCIVCLHGGGPPYSRGSVSSLLGLGLREGVYRKRVCLMMGMKKVKGVGKLLTRHCLIRCRERRDVDFWVEDL